MAGFVSQMPWRCSIRIRHAVDTPDCPFLQSPCFAGRNREALATPVVAGRPTPRCIRAVRRTWPTKKEALVSKQLATRALFADALAGQINRRTLLTRAAALGLSAPVAAALANETARTALAGEEGTLEITYYNWITDLHPDIEEINAEFTGTYPVA